jgi:hypothetical protein
VSIVGLGFFQIFMHFCKICHDSLYIILSSRALHQKYISISSGAARRWLAEARKSSLVRKRDGFSVDATTIENPTKFFRAENYHQNFWQKWRLRIVALLFLLPISWGAFNGVLPEAALPYVETVQDSATAVYVLGLVAALLERKLDAEVIEM